MNGDGKPLSRMQRDFMLSMPQDLFGRVDVARLCAQLDTHEQERVEVAAILQNTLTLIDLTGVESDAMDDVTDNLNALMLRLADSD